MLNTPGLLGLGPGPELQLLALPLLEDTVLHVTQVLQTRPVDCAVGCSLVDP